MKFYAIYIKPDAKQPLENLTAVSSKFAFMAGIFQGFWALYHRIWWLAVFLFLIEGIMATCRVYGVMSEISLITINLAIFALVGFCAPGWREDYLKRKGYLLMDVVVADNEMEARRRYLETHLSHPPSANPWQTASGVTV